LALLPGGERNRVRLAVARSHRNRNAWSLSAVLNHRSLGQLHHRSGATQEAVWSGRRSAAPGWNPAGVAWLQRSPSGARLSSSVRNRGGNRVIRWGLDMARFEILSAMFQLLGRWAAEQTGGSITSDGSLGGVVVHSAASKGCRGRTGTPEGQGRQESGQGSGGQRTDDDWQGGA